MCLNYRMSINSTIAPAAPAPAPAPAPATGFFATIANAVTSVLPGNNKNSKKGTNANPTNAFVSVNSASAPIVSPFGIIKKNNSGKNSSKNKNNSGKNKVAPNPFATTTNVIVTAPATPVTNPFNVPTKGGMAPVNFCYGPRMRQPSEEIMQWATTAGVPTPTGPEMRNVAHGGKRRTHKRRTHRVKHRKSHKKHTRKHRTVKRKTQRNKRRN